METVDTTAEQLKIAGTKLYKEKCYHHACLKYTEAINMDNTCSNYYNNRYVLLRLFCSV